MPAKLSSFVIWLLVAMSVTAWSLRLVSKAPAAPLSTVSAGDNVATTGDLSKVFGAPVVASAGPGGAPEPALASRLKLTGVVAPKPPATEGIALIAVDGKMPRAYAVGARLDDSLVLKSVGLRSASVANGDAETVTLELPPPPVAATGRLVPVAGAPGAGSYDPVNAQPAPPAQPSPNGAPPVFQSGVVPAPARQPQGISAQ